jgi:hypothetical protein
MLPKKVKVMGKNFTVELTKSMDEKKGYDNWGKTDFFQNKITLDKEVNQDQLEETFIHELLHCLLSETNLNKELNEGKKIEEEDFVRRLSPLLYQVLKENEIHF